MKILKSILTLNLILIFSIGSLRAAGPGDIQIPVDYKLLMMDEIRELVVYPDAARELGETGFVLVSFSYDEQGNFVIRETNSSSEMLRRYVVERLGELRMCSHARKPDLVYNMRFDFKLL